MLSCALMGSVRRGSWKAYLPYLGLNVIVSAITVLLVLAIWNGSSSSSKDTPTPTVDVVSQVDEYIPTETPTKIPSPTPVTYIVRGGDTMLGIATEFGVSIDALMIANRLQDPNSLTAGQLLVIPIGEDILLEEEG
ncbi:MAG: LysM peptidoglycan-binding domain-containing protein, partial [Anaerolineales bacterium]